ncbi:MAG TPA: SDR family NAD(P)-dependent oxidoreductase, partial [Roseiflexaceae bacterium]
MPSTEVLKGKIAWVTGGGSGIGLAGGIELARAGAHVVISGRNHDTLAAAERQVKTVGSCEAIALDVSNKQAVAKAAERIGRVDILVNSAGINDPKRNFFNVSAEAWDRIVGINLSG